jgi:formate hydrogenlyase subunit 3/multisubunit Na+/H+ antiporter MnhD subunit
VNAFILLLIWALPVLLAVLAGQRYARWLMVLAPLPALVAGAALPVGASVSLPWLLLGIELGLDDTGRVFLLFSGLLWLVASLYAAGTPLNERNAARYRVFFLLAMAGNLGLIVAQDMASFYFGFTLMGLAAYGLIAQPASQRARRAARRYLVWTIAGELILFVAIVLLAAQNGGALAFGVLASNPPAGLIVPLLIVGFGIKLALPGLHFWLPQAYAVTPPAAVAVLSGAMIKAGLLGWLRFLPPGDAVLAGWGQVMIGIGVTGIFFGALFALLQQRPRLVLGYSSISKMGVLTTGMGAALAWPTAAPVLIGALVIYAAHHALVKAALFLGLGLAERGGLRPWLLVGLGFLALALAGAPLTSGALAKSALSAGLPQPAHDLLSVLAASAFATTLVMARFLFLSLHQRTGVTSPHATVSVIAWLVLLAVIAVFPFAFADAGDLITGSVPVSAGALLAALALLLGARLPARIVLGNRRVAGRRLVSHFHKGVRGLTGAASQASLILSSALRSAGEPVRLSMKRRLIGLKMSSDSEYRWPLAGSVWLAIAGLLLGAFVLSP